MGDSLLAREMHTSVAGLDATALPPTMHSRKLDWFLWHCLDYPRPTYRRLDHQGFFHLHGNWIPCESDPAWDDSGYRPGWTAVCGDAQAACDWAMPSTPEWSAASLVYRTDAAGAAAELLVEGGPGRLLAWDESAAQWRDGHGLCLSFRQDPSGPRTGNTTYQKRLALRRAEGWQGETRLSLRRAPGCDGRLMLWGLEAWEAGRGVLHLINSARGSHTLEMLVASLENEVRGHSPDLVVLELPLLNMLHHSPARQQAVHWVWDVVWGDRPGAENDWALLRPAAGEAAPEVLLVIPHHSRAHLTPEDGWADVGGTTVEAYYDAVRELLRSRGDVPYLDLADAFMDAIDADPAFATRYQALTGSSPDGDSYTSDGVHQNDRGSAVYARHLCASLRGAG